MSAAQEIEAFNATHADKYDGSVLPITPTKKVVIVTCMDARIVPSNHFGIDEGEAHLIRNAGGRAPDALRSLVISQQLIPQGPTEVVVIQHTECGMLTFTNEQARAKAKEGLNLTEGSSGAEYLDRLDFLPFPDLEDNVRRDVQFLKDSDLVKSDKMSGYVFDLKSQRLKKIV